MSLDNPEKMKWWGWGLESESYALPDPDYFWSFLETKLGPLQQSSRVSSLNDIPVPANRLAQLDLDRLKEIFGDEGFSTDNSDRLVHALGKSYLDLLRIRQGRVEAAPDVVVFPENEEQIQALLELASQQGWTIVPFGGGTSVVGGVEPLSDHRPVLTVNLQRMNRVLDIDHASNTARVQSGILGPDLEKELNGSGFTLGHFPQSFEFSTLGGWIATRSAGQNSTKYGKIEQMVVSLRMTTPTSIMDLPEVPADAVGPSLLHCLIGSEGTLGIITQAVVRIHHMPEHRAFAAYLFPDFSAGVTAVRDMLQAGLRPAVLRLADPEETAVALELSKTPSLSFKERVAQWYVRFRGFDVKQSAVLVLIFEGPQDLVSAAKRETNRYVKDGLSLGSLPARKWMKERFRHPYLRDDLLDRSVMVDTLETAAPWEKLPELYNAVRRTLADSLLSTAPGALVFTHLSHAYPDGASLYFTFMAQQQAGKELEQWQMVKEAATTAILERGGALSHHHGIGSMHKVWMESYLGQAGMSLLTNIKINVDPNNIMNPGKLLGA